MLKLRLKKCTIHRYFYISSRIRVIRSNMLYAIKNVLYVKIFVGYFNYNLEKISKLYNHKNSKNRFIYIT
jgi:hypothetical protein